MSLTSLNSDAATVRQQIADQNALYAYQMSPVSNFRPYPGPQGPGVAVTRDGSAQQFVDAESLLRNQNFVASNDPTYRAQQDRCFFPYMQQPTQLPCVQVDLTPRVSYTSRSCDPLSGATIDRFDLLQHPGQGFQYGYAAFGVDTVQQLKDEMDHQRRMA